ncbi:hypothetical protein BGX26_002686 [Mortierella sp. AD094]|nr:hypothetical protein BGX26_002686 [Mortierella sp. AD094]
MSVLISFFEYVLKHSTRSNGLKALLAISAYYVYSYRGHAIGTRRRLDLKQPKGAVPLLGHLPLLASVPLNELYQFLEKQNNELGPVWSISIPGFGRMIQIDTPENLEHVLKTNFWGYGKGPLFVDIVKDTSGHGIFASDGARWKFQRQLAVSIFSIKAFREFTSSVFVVVAKKVIEALGKAADEGTTIDLQKMMLHFTLDTFGAVSFGESFGCLDNIDQNVPFAEAIDDMLEIIANRINDPMWKIRERLNGTSKRAADRCKLIHDYARNIMDKRRREGYHAEKKDFLQLFMEGKDEHALRVFPVSPRNLRYCEKDDVLPDGTKVYAGEWVSWSSYVMGRSESIWGPDAKEYKPSRWLNTEKPSPTKFNAFHAGPRICIGQQFAIIEALTVIGMIFQSFNLELEDPSRVPTYRPSLTFPMVGGLSVRVTRRSGATAH